MVNIKAMPLNEITKKINASRKKNQGLSLDHPNINRS